MERNRVRAGTSVAELAGFLLIVSEGSFGAEFRAGERPAVTAEEVVDDDLYIFGDEITIDGTVKEDVIAFGRVVRVNGSVEGDLITSGQAIVINGEVGDDVRMAGQILKIDKDAVFTDDVIAAGFSLESADDSSVGGDLVYAGYQTLLAGDVGGKVNGAMANCEIGDNVNLTTEGDPTGPQAYTVGSRPPVSIPNVPPGLTIRDTARIGGRLKYESPEEADIAAEANIIGEIRHDIPGDENARPPTLREKAQSVLGRYAALLIVGSSWVISQEAGSSAAPSPLWTRNALCRLWLASCCWP